MKVTFLGTAAAPSFPLTFCRCKNCKITTKHELHDGEMVDCYLMECTK